MSVHLKMIPKAFIVFLVCLFGQSFSGKCLAQQQVGELAIDAASHSAVKMHQANATPDSTATAPKLSIAPIIACGLLGLVAGAGVGGLIDRPHKTPEGEPADLTNGIVVGWAVGAVAGAYFGYRLAKRDAKRQKALSDSDRVEMKK